LDFNSSKNFVSLKQKKMGNLTLTDRTINKYFGYLRNLDNNSKKRLIVKLTESIEVTKGKSFELKSIFGAWEDSKDSDEIINQIRESRVNKQDIEEM